MKKFDLIIIGGGAGAFAAAVRANELKKQTLIINTGLPLGGTCVNVGCVPSKRLLWASELLHQTQHHGFSGIELAIKKFDFSKVIQEELALVSQMRQEKYVQVLSNLEYVQAISGRAKFISPVAVEVDGKKIMAKKIIIAVGSTARVPEILGLQKVGFLTHIEALKLKKQPRSLIIIGAGPLGLEFAQMYARFGTTVTILQRSSRILPRAEKELTKRLTEILIAEKITIKTRVEIKSVSQRGAQKIISLKVNGRAEKIQAEEILLASGKIPNTTNLGLEKIGVQIDQRQAVIVNKNFQTATKNIFAVGDVISAPLRLETTAGREGTLATDNALTGSSLSLDYQTVPYTVFTDPQLAGVGLTEEEQIKELGLCACRTVQFTSVPKAIIMGQTTGLIKMLIHPETQQIMGVHILGPQAGELIAQAMILIKNKNTIEEVVNSLPMFPTLAEALKIVALSFTKDISKLSCCI